MVRFLIDANLPRRLAIWHSAQFDRVADHDDTWSDSQVWDYAQEHNLIIVSKDADFSDRAMLSTPPPRVVHLWLGNMRLAAFRQFLMDHWSDIQSRAPLNRLLIVTPDSMVGIE